MQHRHELLGWQAHDSCPSSWAKTFDSFAACVKFVIPQIKDLYLEPGGTYYEGATVKKGEPIDYEYDGM